MLTSCTGAINLPIFLVIFKLCFPVGWSAPFAMVNWTMIRFPNEVFFVFSWMGACAALRFQANMYAPFCEGCLPMWLWSFYRKVCSCSYQWLEERKVHKNDVSAGWLVFWLLWKNKVQGENNNVVLIQLSTCAIENSQNKLWLMVEIENAMWRQYKKNCLITLTAFLNSVSW